VGSGSDQRMRTIVVDGRRYGLSIRENRDRVVVLTAFPSGTRNCHLRLRLRHDPKNWDVLGSIHRPAFAESLIRHARQRGWLTTMEIDDGVAFAREALAANPLPPSTGH
jgi:hypothetical protein